MRHFDLVIIGTGSGNSLPGPDFDSWDIAIVEDNLFGGTCTNVGCIPTKMYVHPADLADGARQAGPLGVHATIDSVDWPGMRDRIFGRIDKIEASGRRYREGDKCPNITVFAGFGTFAGHKTLEIALTGGGTETITADRFVIAAGSRVVMPDIPGLDDLPAGLVHTSDTIMRIDELPASIVVVGGGYIGAEFCHVFTSFGTTVTQVCRNPRLLRRHDADIAETFTTHARQRYDVRLSTDVTGVKPGTSTGPSGLTVFLSDDTVVEADLRADRHRPPAERRPDAGRGHRGDAGRARPGGRGRVPADGGRRHLRPRRRLQRVPAQARREPRGAHRRAQPGAPGHACGRRTTGSSRPPCSPTRRSPRSA